MSKAWVPRRYKDKDLWYKPDAVIDDYIKDLESSWNPKKTLRMSIIQGTRDPVKLQMVIPPALLNSAGGGMGIGATCAEKLSDLPSYQVNYDDWHDNIKGDK